MVKGIEWTAPAVEIKDKPRFSFRSFMLDVARNFKSKEVVKIVNSRSIQLAVLGWQCSAFIMVFVTKRVFDKHSPRLYVIVCKPLGI